MEHPEMAYQDVVLEQPIRIKSHELKMDKNKDGDEIILGSGGFGSVYKAIYHPKGIVAFKQMSKTGTLTERNKTVLMREARRLKQLTNHEQILKLHGVIMEKDNYGLVLEYMHFGSVCQFLQEFDLETALLLRISKQVIEAMCWLHGHSPPVKHLDIKADNILINNYFNAKVCDFGLSEWRNTTMMMTQTLEKPVRSATITHIAPEVLCDINCESTTAWDIYAFGITLWEIFSGCLPYAGKSIDVIRSCVLNNQRPDLTKLVKKCPKEIEHMMCNCWDEHVEQRPTFAELQRNIEELFNKYITQLLEALFSVRKQIIVKYKPDSELYKCTMHFDNIKNNGLVGDVSELLEQSSLTNIVRSVDDNVIATPNILPIDRNSSAADTKIISAVVNRIGNMNSNCASQDRNMNPEVANHVTKMDTIVENSYRNMNPNVTSHARNMNPNVTSHARNVNPNVANHPRNVNPNVSSHPRNVNPNVASPIRKITPVVTDPHKHFIPNVALTTESMVSSYDNIWSSLAAPILSQSPNQALLGTGSVSNVVEPLHGKEYLLEAQIMDMNLCGAPIIGAVSYISQDRMIPVDGNNEAENFELQLLMQQIHLNSNKEELVQKNKSCAGHNSEMKSSDKYWTSYHQGQSMSLQGQIVSPQGQTAKVHPQGQPVEVSLQGHTAKMNFQGQTVTASLQGQTEKVSPQAQTMSHEPERNAARKLFTDLSTGGNESCLKLLQDKHNKLKEEVTVGLMESWPNRPVTDLTSKTHATVNMLPNFAVLMSSEEYVPLKDSCEIEECVSNYAIANLKSVASTILPNVNVLSSKEYLSQQESVQDKRMELTLNEKERFPCIGQEAKSFENSITGELIKRSLTIDELSNVNAFVKYSLNGTSPEENQTRFSIQTSPTSYNEEAMETSVLSNTSISEIPNVGQQQMTPAYSPELQQQTVPATPKHFVLPENSQQMMTPIHEGMEQLNDNQLQQTAVNEYFTHAQLRALGVYLHSLNIANSEQASQHFSKRHPVQLNDGQIQPTDSLMSQQAINMSPMAQQMTQLPFYATQNFLQPFSVPYGDISSLKPILYQGPMNTVTPTVGRNLSWAATHPEYSPCKEPFPDSRPQNKPENETFRDTRPTMPSPDADCNNSYSMANSTPSFTSQKSHHSLKSWAETEVVDVTADQAEAPITISHKHAGGGYTHMTMNTLHGEHLPNLQIGNNMTMTVYGCSKKGKHLKLKKERTCKMTDLPISESPLTLDQRDIIAEEIGKDWKSLCRELQLTDANIYQLRYEFLNTGGLYEVMYQAILQWTEINGQRATVKVMAESLWNIEREDIALKLK